MIPLFLGLVVLVDLKAATLKVDHPELRLEAAAVVGKPATPTPVGVYALRRAHSSRLGMDILVFHKDGQAIWAIHPNIRSRARQLATPTPADNALSNGCIGIDAATFDRLWDTDHELVLQIYNPQE